MAPSVFQALGQSVPPTGEDGKPVELGEGLLVAKRGARQQLINRALRSSCLRASTAMALAAPAILAP